MEPLNNPPLSWEGIKSSHQENQVSFLKMCFEYIWNNISYLIAEKILAIWSRTFQGAEEQKIATSLGDKKISPISIEEGQKEEQVSPEAPPFSPEEPIASEIRISPEKAIFPGMEPSPEMKKQHGLSASAAAAKGAALQAALRGIVKKTGAKEAVQNSNVSRQQVFLLRDVEAVLKKGAERAKEEEKLVNDLFDLSSEGAIVGSHEVHKPSLSTFDISFPRDVKEKGFSRNDLTEQEYLECKGKLPFSDILSLQQEENFLNFQTKELYKNIQKKFTYQIEDGKPKTTSLKHLRHLFATGQLPENTKIMDEWGGSLTLGKHIEWKTLFYSLLTTPLPPPTHYFSPSFVSGEQKKAYAICEKYKWSYRKPDGQTETVDWKTLHFRAFIGIPMNNLKPLQKAGEEPLTPEFVSAMTAIPWKMTGSALVESKNKEDVGKRLEEVQAKPFRVNMLTLRELHNFPTARDAIMKRLTENARFDAVMTAQFQLLDMHNENLGVSPIPNEEYALYQDISFRVAEIQDPLPLKMLFIRYLNGEITEQTNIQFTQKVVGADGVVKEEQVNKPLRELPDLLKAFDTPWKFDIFDTDLSLGVSNELEIIDGERHVPIRSALFGVPSINDEPLSDALLQRLMDDGERNARIKHWSQKLDAPIYQSLKSDTKERLHIVLDAVLAMYSLNEYKRLGKGDTIKQMRQNFVKSMSRMPFDPGIASVWDVIGRDIKGITENTPAAQLKREKIAGQLFPRISVHQQKALFERQEREHKYLTSYHNLLHSAEKGEALLQQIQSFIEQPQTPFDSIHRATWLQFMIENREILLSDPSQLELVRAGICKQTEPTYFRVTAAMYPLLMDVHSLYKHVYPRKSPKDIGEMIGDYRYPLMTIVNAAAQNLVGDAKARALAQIIQQKINAVQNPHLFF